MKNQILIFLLIILVFSMQAQVLKTRNISSDTTWTTDTVKIYNDIVIENQATLQIDPGVYVEFQGNFSLTVNGRINAIGSQYDTINFTISDTTSFGDTATLQGGWGSIKLLDNTTDTSVFSYCKFSYGKAIEPGMAIDNLNEENMGGALFVKNYANLVCNNSTFYHNKATWSGGALWVKNCSSVILFNNTFKENEVYQDGGGAILESCVSAIISGNTFVLNRAINFYLTEWGLFAVGAGGGLRINLNCNALVYNNRFFNNYSVAGALYETAYNCLISNNIIANNKGCGLYSGITFSISRYINNTIANNLSYGYVGGIEFFSPYLVMRNNIVYGNEGDWDWPEPVQIYTPDPIKADFSYGCNPDEPIYYEGEGNIQDDPMFVNPTAGAGPEYDGSSADWSLQNSSPCVNTGTPDTTGLNLPELDIAGNPRLYGIRIDMGAYENQVVVGLPQNPYVNSKIEIIPNPFKDNFAINLFGENKINRISVLNQSGITIRNMEQLPTDGFMVIDLNGYTSGLYLVVVEYNDGTRKVEKVLKQ